MQREGSCFDKSSAASALAKSHRGPWRVHLHGATARTFAFYTKTARPGPRRLVRFNKCAFREAEISFSLIFIFIFVLFIFFDSPAAGISIAQSTKEVMFRFLYYFLVST